MRSIEQYLWFALAGAAIAMVVVYVIGRSGRWGATPIRLTLSGVAVGAVFTGFTLGLTLLNPAAFDQMRYWEAGSITGRGWDVTAAVLPFVIAGLIVTAVVARGLDALALGDDMARALGTRLVRVRAFGLIGITLLCGAAAAAAGPIVFVGLMIPHVARWLVGANQRWILAFSALGAPALVLASDILGRIALRPAELPVGIVSAFLGAPALIWLVRRRTVGQP
jgi:iron complex transport system permease protein